jgi:hypothetical protein
MPILSQKQGSDSGHEQRRDPDMRGADTRMVGDERLYVYAWCREIGVFGAFCVVYTANQEPERKRHRAGTA